MTWLWKKLTLFFYRRWCASLGPEGRIPDGVPGIRDRDNPCTGYAPRAYCGGDWNDCETDGHYLCHGCCHRSPDAGEDRGRDWLRVLEVREC